MPRLRSGFVYDLIEIEVVTVAISYFIDLPRFLLSFPFELRLLFAVLANAAVP
jgi:hypothetical protein